ncbi:4-oxalocrotonate tautomerase [Eisenbergiella sp.]
MEKKKNLCAMIPESLHTQARMEQETLELTLSQYVEMVLKEHFEGGKVMDGKTRTLAFQVSEELFGRIKEHLKKTGMSQKDFVIRLIEQALEEEETDNTVAAEAEENELEANRTEAMGTEPAGEEAPDLEEY